MKLAFVGLDDQTLAVARAAVASGRHTVASAADLSAEKLAELAAVSGAAPAETHWELLLTGSAVDAVIVAAAEDQEVRADQLRKLVQAGVPLLVSHPALDSMLVYYELGMIQEEAGGVLLPLLAWRWHPASRRLRDLVGEHERSEIGAASQVTIDRAIDVCDKRSVLGWLARDVDLIRDVFADVRRVAALGDPNDPATFGHLAVQMSAGDSSAARWAVSQANGEPAALLTLSGARGKVILHMPQSGMPQSGRWTWETRIGGESKAETFDPWDAGAVALDRLEVAVSAGPADKGARGGLWADAARAVELSEAVERSLARSRAIEVYDEDFTDVGTFKGTMTSLGCGLLLGILALVFGVAIITSVIRRSRIVFNNWPYLLAGGLILFLLVQLVLAIVQAAPATKKEKPGRPDKLIE